jgi:acyl-coenzyme A thioesterase PaaI-like protein
MGVAGTAMTEHTGTIDWFRGLPVRPWTRDTYICPGCKRTGGNCVMGALEQEIVDDGLRVRVRFAERHEGGPGVVSGSWLTGLMNEVCGAVLVSRGLFVVNKSLSTRFRRPVPLDSDLRLDAWFVGRTGSDCRAAGRLSLAATGADLVTAEVLSVVRDPSHYARAAAWFADQTVEAATPTSRPRGARDRPQILPRAVRSEIGSPERASDYRPGPPVDGRDP